MNLSIDSIRKSIVQIVLLIAVLCTVFGIEKYPFSNYPMYSKTTLSSKRHTLLSVDYSGVERLISVADISPIGRIHLGYVLRKYIDGDVQSKKNIHKIVKGLFTNHSEFKEIKIVQVKILLPFNDQIGFSYKVEGIVELFDRSRLDL